MKRSTLIFLSLMLVAFFTATAQNDELPPNPEPGKCYVKCITKDIFKEVEETVMVSPEYKKLTIVPATYKMVEDRVLIKEASKKLIYVPAVFQTEEVSYIKKERRTDLEVVPATFGSDSRVIEIYPVTSGWEYTQLDDCPSVNKEDCMVACFKEYPAQHKTVSLTTLTKDAFTKDIPVAEIPASYTKQVVKTPARMEEVDIPAEYTTISRRVVDVPAHKKEVVVPAEYVTVKRTVLDKKGGMTVWEEVDCDLVGNNNVLPILYDYNSAVITPDSKRIIDENLLVLLNESPNIRVEILSHTDSRGNDDYNMALSQQRAQAVVNYLVSKGIDRNRMVAKGLGETRLKNHCSNGVDCTSAQHQENRRTEFRIL